MSLENNQLTEDKSKRLRHNLLFTREFDITDTWNTLFNNVDEEQVFDIMNRGFSLSDLKSYFMMHSLDDELYDVAHKYMSAITAKYKGLTMNTRMSDMERAVATQPLELLMATRLQIENDSIPRGEEIVEIFDGYFRYLVEVDGIVAEPTEEEWLEAIIE